MDPWNFARMLSKVVRVREENSRTCQMRVRDSRELLSPDSFTSYGRISGIFVVAWPKSPEKGKDEWDTTTVGKFVPESIKYIAHQIELEKQIASTWQLMLLNCRKVYAIKLTSFFATFFSLFLTFKPQSISKFKFTNRSVNNFMKIFMCDIDFRLRWILMATVVT